MNINDIAKSFTRFFIPGLAFSFFIILLPTILLIGLAAFSSYTKLFDASFLLSVSLLIGYLLDSVKFYRYNFDYFNYSKNKRELIEQLSGILNMNTSTHDPDDLLVPIWYSDKETYDRIFQDRAVWVMICTTSSVIALSSILVIGILIYKYYTINEFIGWQWVIPPVLLLTSWISTATGSQEKMLHHKKLLKVIWEYQENKKISQPSNQPV